MAITQTQVDNVQTEYIGRADVYVGCTKPADLTAMVLTSGVPAGGTIVGLTSGPAEVDYKPTVAGVSVEQTLNEIAPRVTGETVTVKFKCAEATYINLRTAMQTSTLVSSGSAPVIRKMFVGGISALTSQTVTLVSPLAGGRYEHVTIYNAYSVDGLKHSYKNTETRMVDVTLTGYADVTRTAGDQLYQLIQETAL